MICQSLQSKAELPTSDFNAQMSADFEDDGGTGVNMDLNLTNISHLYTFPEPDPIGVMVGLLVFYSVVALIALLSNVLIICVVKRRLVPRNTVNVFLASLALSDLLLVLLSVFDGVAYVNRGWTSGLWACKFQSLLIEVSFSVSTLTLVAVSFERYLSICHPHMKKRSIKATMFIIVGIWIVAVAICSPLLHGYDVYYHMDHEDKTKELVCRNAGWSVKYRIIYYYSYSIVVYVIPLVVMGMAHWRISKSINETARRPSLIPVASNEAHRLRDCAKTVCRTIQEEDSGISTNEVSEMRPNDSEVWKTISNLATRGWMNSLSTSRRRRQKDAERENGRREKRLKVIKILFVVTVTFFVLWTPFILVRLLVLVGVHVNEYVYKFTEVLIMSSTAVNGFIYAFMSPSFRKAFKAFCTCRTLSEFSKDSGPSLSSDEPRHKRSSHASNYSSSNSEVPCGNRPPELAAAKRNENGHALKSEWKESNWEQAPILKHGHSPSMQGTELTTISVNGRNHFANGKRLSFQYEGKVRV